MSKTDDRLRQDAAERSFVEFNQHAFEAGVGIQMALLEASSRFAGEVAAFAARRVERNVGDLARLSDARTTDDLVKLQQEHVRRLVDDYKFETGRLVAITERAVKDGAEAVRASSFAPPAMPRAD